MQSKELGFETLIVNPVSHHLTMSFFCFERYGSVSCGSSWSSFISSDAALAKCPGTVR